MSTDSVAIICPGCGGVGAVANVAVHHATELAKRFHITLVSDSFPLDDLPGVTKLTIIPLRFGVLRRFAHVPNEVAFALAARVAVARLHADMPVDIVVCHGHPVAALAARRLRLKLGIPFALVTHGDIFDRPKGTYDSRLKWLYQRTTKSAYRGACLVVALSPYIRELAIRGGARPEWVVVIPNGIDPAEIGLGEIEPYCPKASRNCLELLYIGRLSVEKGVDVLLEAANLLAAWGVRFRLRIVGDGPEASNLRLRVAKSRLNRFVNFLGPIPRKNLGALYRSIDVVCVPSRSDTLPTVVLEAMVAGVPVVGSAAGGIPFMVQDGETGWLVPRDQPEAMANLFQAISKDRSVLPKLSIAARRSADQHFSWQRIGEQLADRINAVVNI